MKHIPLFEIADQVLRGGTLSNKLFGSDFDFEQIDWTTPSLLSVPIDGAIPGRSGKLKPIHEGNESFPKMSELKHQTARGKLLHFFANHELLAMETMALTLLKFPDAPLAFRQGVYKTLQDEQRHFKSYQSRMEDFGVAIGDFQLNLYFWNTLKTIQTPLDFVTRMSLTFEQANLDFALEFAKQMENVGDERTAKLLREVHDDEVKHVKHGLKWFNEFRTDKEEREWDAYARLLPHPLTPRRAKGKWFSEQSRKEAGFSKEYIEELKIAGGSRGRTPNYYFFNPQCEWEFENPGAVLPKALREKVADLEPLMMWLGKESDVTELSQKPPREWLAQVHSLKGELSEVITTPEQTDKYVDFDSFKPWAWSPSSWKRFGQIAGATQRVRSKPQFTEEVSACWLSKVWWAEKLNVQIESAGIDKFIVKRAYSTSGRGHLVVTADELSKLDLSNCVVEPLLEKCADFSTQFELLANGEVKIFEPRFFKIDSRFQYQGSYLGSGVRPEVPVEYAECVRKYSKERLQVLKTIAEILKKEKYIGPVGVDSLIYRNSSGDLKIHFAVEVNVRMTMGRIALELEQILRKKSLDTNCMWRFYSLKEVEKMGFKNFVEWEKELIKKFGSEKVIATTPAQTSAHTWTVLILN